MGVFSAVVGVVAAVASFIPITIAFVQLILLLAVWRAVAVGTVFLKLLPASFVLIVALVFLFLLAVVVIVFQRQASVEAAADSCEGRMRHAPRVTNTSDHCSRNGGGIHTRRRRPGGACGCMDLGGRLLLLCKAVAVVIEFTLLVARAAAARTFLVSGTTVPFVTIMPLSVPSPLPLPVAIVVVMVSQARLAFLIVFIPIMARGGRVLAPSGARCDVRETNVTDEAFLVAGTLPFLACVVADFSGLIGRPNGTGRRLRCG